VNALWQDFLQQGQEAKKGGRPTALDHQKRELAVTLYNEKKKTIKEICNIMGISKPTLYSYVRSESPCKV